MYWMKQGPLWSQNLAWYTHSRQFMLRLQVTSAWLQDTHYFILFFSLTPANQSSACLSTLSSSRILCIPYPSSNKQTNFKKLEKICCQAIKGATCREKQILWILKKQGNPNLSPICLSTYNNTIYCYSNFHTVVCTNHQQPYSTKSITIPSRAPLDQSTLTQHCCHYASSNVVLNCLYILG